MKHLETPKFCSASSKKIADSDANETWLITVPSDLTQRFILSGCPPTGSFTVCVFCNDRHEIAGRCKHFLAVINLQQQAVGTPCQQKWHFPDKGLTTNCLQKWHMYRLMVIHLCRTETITLDLPSAQMIQNWWSTSRSDSETRCACTGKSRPEKFTSARFVWERLTVHVTWTDVELRTTGLCMLTTTSPSSFCTRRWSTPCAVGLMSRKRKEAHAWKRKKVDTCSSAQSGSFAPCVRTGSDIGLGSPSPWAFTALMMNR